MTSPVIITAEEVEALLREYLVRARLDGNLGTPGVLAPQPNRVNLESLAALRFDIVQVLLMIPPDMVRPLLSHDVFRERELLVSTGLIFEPRGELEERLYAEIAALYSVAWDQPNWVNLFACVQLCSQPFLLPLHPG